MRDKAGTTLEAISAAVGLAVKLHLLCAWMCMRCLIDLGAALQPIATQGRSLYLDFRLTRGESSRLIIEGARE
ncbi:hypothetical protein LJD21_23560, partial [Pseudomonas inefficax]|uniref:hypothetical protein n=1 Tax=Pseudomonas inefficax TaxID=2078786 RepID=UPI00207BA995